jgi:hypothetical protein
MTTINAATKAILNGTKSPVPTTSDMKAALGALYDVLNECGITNGATAFLASKGGNGYQKLPSGIILQWGATGASVGGTSNSFTIPFPNSCFALTAMVASTSATSYVVGTVISANQFNLYCSAGTPACFWIAIGW